MTGIDPMKADLVYFYTPGCPECAAAERALHRFTQAHSDLRTAWVDSSRLASLELRERFDLAYYVAPRQRQKTPAVFVREHALVGARAIAAGLERLGHSPLKGTSPLAAADERAVQASFAHRFQSWSVLTVAGAALVDSLNPCALATLLFLLSALTLTRSDRRDVVRVGLAFTAGVFLTYFLTGLGLFQGLRSLSQVRRLSRLLYPGLGLLCAALAALSFADYRRVKAGAAGQMTLQLPRSIKLLTHAIIRRGLRSECLILAAFVAAVGVSLLEFVCTGQVYLPTLVYMARTTGYRAAALAYLVLYNLVFVLPLALLFTAVAYGQSVTALTRLFQRHLAGFKLATAALFAVFAGWLLALSVGGW